MRFFIWRIGTRGYDVAMRHPLFLVAALLLGLLAAAQPPQTADMQTVAQSGKVTDTQYTNAYFHLTCTLPESELHLNPLIQTESPRARMLQAHHTPAELQDRYNFAVAAEPLSKYATLKTTEQYVRSVRHMFEKEGLKTVKEEFPVDIGGAHFTGTILEEQEPGTIKHYRGMYSAFRRGYILTFDVEAASPEKLDEIVKRVVKFQE